MDYSHTMDVMCESGAIRCEKPTLLCSTLSVLVGHTLAGMSMYTSTYASSYDLSRRAFASPQATASGTLGRTHYSSEQFSSTYVAPTLGDGSLPGANPLQMKEHLAMVELLSSCYPSNSKFLRFCLKNYLRVTTFKSPILNDLQVLSCLRFCFPKEKGKIKYLFLVTRYRQ